MSCLEPTYFDIYIYYSTFHGCMYIPETLQETTRWFLGHSDCEVVYCKVFRKS